MLVNLHAPTERLLQLNLVLFLSQIFELSNLILNFSLRKLTKHKIYILMLNMKNDETGFSAI